MPRLDDLTGRRFDRLTAQWPAGRGHAHGHGKHVHWLCICVCGTLCVIKAGDLRSGNSQSCGCRRTKHGHSTPTTPTYRTWLHMLDRCRNPNTRKWKHYGGRGISVCERWRKFENFLADMGRRPLGKTIDRFPNKDGNYEPGNCRWATKREQLDNAHKPWSQQ